MIKFDFALLDNDLYKNNLLRKEEIFDKFNNSNMIGWMREVSQEEVSTILKLSDEIKKNAMMVMHATAILRKVLNLMVRSCSSSFSSLSIKMSNGLTSLSGLSIAAGMVWTDEDAVGFIMNELNPYNSGVRIPASHGSNSYFPYSFMRIIPKSYSS